MKNNLPERVLQFGTGILLRGLPDYFIDKANRKGIFNGKILVVKSTSGDAREFASPGYTTFVRGVDNGRNVIADYFNESISRVLSAQEDWPLVMASAASPELSVIISNTTEVGLQFKEESVFQSPPHSFPAKLTAFLYKRYQQLGASAPGMVVIPTELIPDNGAILRDITRQLIAFNNIEPAFSEWMDTKITFCNSLVDRIVTHPSEAIRHSFSKPDPLAIQTEPYRLWAIEGDAHVADMLSFASADKGIIINKDISHYRERKLRLLNGTHTISVCLGFLNGHDTVFECMKYPAMRQFITDVMMTEILPTLPSGTPEDNLLFARQIIDRFDNPYAEHRLLNITLQSTMKMKMRNVTTLIRYTDKFGKPPELMCKGFAAYLLFMRAVKKEGGLFYGRRADTFYRIQDDAAEYFCTLWESSPVPELVKKVCQNTALWNADLTSLHGFEKTVLGHLNELQNGAL